MMVSIKSIFTYLNLPDTEIEDLWIEEYASQAMDALHVSQSYDHKVCVLTVENHRVNLPSDLRYIEAITYQYQSPTANQVTKITESISNSTEVTIEDNGTQTTTNITTKSITTPGEIGNNQDHVLRIQHQGVLNNYQVWLSSDMYRNNFKLMKLANRAFASNYHCDNCPNFECISEHTYSITPQKTLQTSLVDGNICIAYMAKAKDECGDLLIPDDVDFKIAIAAYVKMRYAEDKMFRHEENMYRLYYQFKKEWELLSAKVRGKFIIKGIDEDGLVQAHKPLINVIRNSSNFDNQY